MNRLQETKLRRYIRKEALRILKERSSDTKLKDAIDGIQSAVDYVKDLDYELDDKQKKYVTTLFRKAVGAIVVI